MTRISIRMDEELKKEADAILDEMGLNMSSAVNIFAKQLVRTRTFPFAPNLDANKSSNDERRARLESLLNFADQNKRIESGYKFERDECYDR